MDNPRFPFTMKIYRPEVDTDGNPVLDSTGDPTYVVVSLDKVVMFDNTAVRDADGEIVTEEVTEIECGVRTESRTTRTDGDVIAIQTTIHTPLFTTELLFGDICEITDYDRTYKTSIVGKRSFNWGCNIYINEYTN